MTPAIVDGWPPNIDQIDAVFHVKDRPVAYSWGDTIFRSNGIDITPALMAHEAVHCERQGSDPLAWWMRYLADHNFRLEEEVAAHRAEFAFWCRQPGVDKPVGGWRSARERHLAFIASRLSSPLYGRLCSMVEAKKLITQPEVVR